MKRKTGPVPVVLGAKADRVQGGRVPPPPPGGGGGAGADVPATNSFWLKAGLKTGNGQVPLRGDFCKLFNQSQIMGTSVCQKVKKRMAFL